MPPRLIQLLDTQAKATPVGSLDYAEEMFAGVDLALRSQWEPGALRFVVLIGDASSHPKGHPQNTTSKDERDLRREADDAQVHLLAIHLRDERAAEDHGRAEEQFSHLARIRGGTGSALVARRRLPPGGLPAGRGDASPVSSSTAWPAP